MISKKIVFFFICICVCSFNFSQSKDNYLAIAVSSNLKANSNAVLRFQNTHIVINDYDDMVVTEKRIVTVFNKYGNKHTSAYKHYDKNTKIKKIEAKIYDAFGNEIKKVKKSDFTDQSAVSGVTLYSDSRVMYYDYTPINYPYTMEFTSEVAYKNTAFIPYWQPVDGFYLGVEYSEYKIENHLNENLKVKTQNFEGYNIIKGNTYQYAAKNIPPIKYEAYSPNINTFVPKVTFALEQFSLDGVTGSNKNWEDFGKWMNTKLLAGTETIPQESIQKVRQLVNGVDNKIERAKIVYNYMQNRTRYISVQIGIGGWKPMLAQEVDNLGYGDCKGLTNYTKALLEAVDVPSHYTVIYGSNAIKDIDSEFSSIQGNHVILTIPNNDNYIFLECTSQTSPFGHIAGFTDDRDALIITPEGGKIVHTTSYSAQQSTQNTKAQATIEASGALTANVKVVSKGYQYSEHNTIETKDSKAQKLYYKEYWDNINNLEINDITISNNKDAVEFTEKVTLSSPNYVLKAGNRFLLQPNMFNKLSHIPPRYKDRKLDFKINRPFKDYDEYIITFPKSLKIEAMSKGEEITSKFGSYKYSLQEMEGNKIKYTRTLTVNKGNYNKEDYKAYRNFRKQVARHDNTKIALISK